MTKSLPPFDRLVEQFRRLPGVGIKSAKRMTFAVLDMPSEDAQAFADAIIAAVVKSAGIFVKATYAPFVWIHIGIKVFFVW